MGQAITADIATTTGIRRIGTVDMVVISTGIVLISTRLPTITAVRIAIDTSRM